MTSFIDQIDELRELMNAGAGQAHEHLRTLGLDMVSNDKNILDHIARLVDDHAMRRRDIVAKLVALAEDLDRAQGHSKNAHVPPPLDVDFPRMMRGSLQ